MRIFGQRNVKLKSILYRDTLSLHGQFFELDILQDNFPKFILYRKDAVYSCRQELFKRSISFQSSALACGSAKYQCVNLVYLYWWLLSCISVKYYNTVNNGHISNIPYHGLTIFAHIKEINQFKHHTNHNANPSELQLISG